MNAKNTKGKGQMLKIKIKKSNLKDFKHTLFYIKPPLSFMSTDRLHLENTKFQWTKHNRIANSDVSNMNEVPKLNCFTLTSDNTLNSVTNASYLTENNDDNIKMLEISSTDLDVDNCLIKPEPEPQANVDLDTLTSNDTFNSVTNASYITENNDVIIKVIKSSSTDLDVDNCLIKPEPEPQANVDLDTLTSNDTFNSVTNASYITENNDVIIKVIESSSTDLDIDNSLIEPQANVDIIDFLSDYEEKDETDIVNVKNISEINEDPVDGSNLDQEYAIMIPISVKEAKAAVKVYKSFSYGRLHCKICNKPFYNENRLQVHMRMHDTHFSGSFHCDICDFYYKSDLLLKTHMTEKHMYKYLCRKCPEVSFHRRSAKQHYISSHLQKDERLHTKANGYDDIRPNWLSNKGRKQAKDVSTVKPTKKSKKVPDDFLIYTPVPHDEQYSLVLDRQNSKNYKKSNYKCNLCFRGFRETVPFEKHMAKHDPAISGPVQCDMCKLHFKNLRKLYNHMSMTHLSKYSCQMCSYVSYNRRQSVIHYRWHKNVTYPCPHCTMVFNKYSSQLTHIRLKHPSTYLCNLCGHSFVSETGLYNHKQISHTKKEIETSTTAKIGKSDPLYCSDCKMGFVNETAYNTHLGSSYKHTTENLSTKPNRTLKRLKEDIDSGKKTRGRPSRGGVCSDVLYNGISTSTQCEVCNVVLPSDVMTRRHYETEHPGVDYLKRYMCDVCGHTTKHYANLLVHMRVHTLEKPYGCPHCARRFNKVGNRDRHLVVHTGERRYACPHCARRFTQSTACKLHVQTVHLKIPYAPWNKKNRRQRKEQELASNASTSPVPEVAAQVTMDPQGNYLNAYVTYKDDI